MKYQVTIGLPTINQAFNIEHALNSIIMAVNFVQIKNYILVVCANGCTDNTEAVVYSFIKNHPQINCQLITSNPGVVNAQRKIVQNYPADIFIFPDDDGQIDKKSIKLLLDELKNPKTIVAYAKSLSLKDNSKKQSSLAEKMGLLYDSQNMLTSREYFHGRLFATKDWHVPDDVEILKRAQKNKHNSEILKYCRNNILLAADDIYMSSYIMDKYGLEAIKQVAMAHCYSWPVATFYDWLNIYRRRNIEMEKMNRWFPEYNYLWSHLNRKTDWSKWLKAGLGDKFIWLSYLFMRGLFFVYLKIEFLLLKTGFYEPPEQWKTTKSTKKKIK